MLVQRMYINIAHTVYHQANAFQITWMFRHSDKNSEGGQTCGLKPAFG